MSELFLSQVELNNLCSVKSQNLLFINYKATFTLFITNIVLNVYIVLLKDVLMKKRHNKRHSLVIR